ncbi:hypothetical protein BH11MYX4_BH11MYX4_66010 [soil metagenome]|jgi:hypothetical protein
MPLMPRTVDRSIARMIATKRIITGSLSLAAGLGLTAYAIDHGGAPTAGLGLALLIFFAGGTWTLRDGLRLRRELKSR